MDEQTQQLAHAAAEKAKQELGIANPGQAQPPKQVKMGVTHDAMWVYLHIDGKSVGMTLLTARELALALRQACNQVEQGK